MIQRLRDIRLIPVVLAAAGALLVLKTVGLITEGGYTLGAGHLARSDRMAREAAELAANELLHKTQAPNAGKAALAKDALGFQDVTGSVANKPKDGSNAKTESKTDEKEGAAKKAAPVDPKPVPDGTVVQLDPKPVSAAERAVLERLTERRQELEERERELQVRETLLQAQEKRVEDKVRELKDVEAKIAAAAKKKEENEQARLKGLVTMYENMKAKDAAKIFERLDIRLATEVANQITPRRMSDILAQMSPEAAERLTVELANRSAMQNAAEQAELPKIEGRRNGS